MELDTSGGHVDYRHVQRLWVSQAELVASRGLGHGLALEARLPLRHVTTRIRFVDPAGQPFDPREGFIHHRNETLVKPSDPWLLLHGGKSRGRWSFGARVGVALPLGRTEEDPIALGAAGLTHQHIQFGTGTVDPILGVGVSRRMGRGTLTLDGLGRFTVAMNDHGYEAGERQQASLGYAQPVGTWRPRVSLDVVREGAERWNGRVDDDEGNLGRTDLLASVTIGRGAWWAGVQVPLAQRVVGAQLATPVIVSLGWGR